MTDESQLWPSTLWEVQVHSFCLTDLVTAITPLLVLPSPSSSLVTATLHSVWDFAASKYRGEHVSFVYVSVSLHLTQWLPSPPILLQVAATHCLLGLNRIPLCIYATCCLFIHNSTTEFMYKSHIFYLRYVHWELNGAQQDLKGKGTQKSDDGNSALQKQISVESSGNYLFNKLEKEGKTYEFLEQEPSNILNNMIKSSQETTA